MKKLLFLLLTLAIAVSSFAQQQVTKGEYFWDSDPGFGNGTAFTFSSPGSSVDEQFEFNTTDLQPGVHLLMFRTKTDAGKWSMTHKKTVVVSNDYQSPIEYAEYFWDTDPGFGNGDTLDLTAIGDTAISDMEIDVPAGLSLGDHSLNVRVRSASGEWSLFHTDTITICTTYGPVAGFEYEQQGLVFEFADSSKFGETYSWNFDDGSQDDTARNPIHKFPGPGNYKVIQTVQNPCGTDIFSRTISLGGIQQVTPDVVGQNGLITGGVIGVGFVKDSGRVFFQKHNSPSDSIIPETSVFVDAATLAFSADLSRVDTGFYRIIYLVNDTAYYTLDSALYVESMIEPSLSISVEGLRTVRAGRFFDMHLVIENTGNVDALMVPIFFNAHSLHNLNHFGMFFQYDNLADEVDTLKNMNQAYIDSGGSADFPGTFILEYDSTDGELGSKILSFVAPRIKPGITKYNVTCVMYGLDVVVGARASVMEPLLPSDAREIREGDSIEARDCVAKAIICAKGLALRIADLGGALGCAKDLFGLLDMIVADAGGKSLSDMIVDGVIGSDSKKIEEDPFAKMVNLSQKPIDYPSAVIGMLTSCAPLILKATFPGAAVIKPMIQAITKSEDLQLFSKVNSIKGFVTQDLPCFMDLFESCGDNFTDILFSSIFAVDPNEKYGPGISGNPYINPGEPLQYTIRYENLDSATAAAQEVFIYDSLDPNVYDFETFNFTGYGWDTLSFGSYAVEKDGVLRFTDIIDYRPQEPNFVKVTGEFDLMTGIAIWKFTTLDTNTFQLTNDPLAGFLPPNNTSPEGEGFVMFSVELQQGLTEGTPIRNSATIIFDVNDPIYTNTWENLFDITPPESAVNPISATSSDTVISLSWSGNDNLSGLKSYDIYVSADNGPYYLLVPNTTSTSLDIIGEVGVTYRFFSVARDSAGNVESKPATHDAETTIVLSIEDLPEERSSHWLGQNIPNPASGATIIPYYVNSTESVSMVLFNYQGKAVKQLINGEERSPGLYNNEVDLSSFSKGIYFYQLKIGDQSFTRKLILQ